ncbi:hypothetical protein [Rhizorhabdus histidinilytica]|uniref:hypothetical protein n=1 Tax=Rhizorhabdus histidinilytica TaxID=439228 RepID=UPI00321F77FB
MTDTTIEAEQLDRPTGSAALIAGGLLISLGLMAAFVWAVTNPVGYLGEIDESKLMTKYWAGILTAAALSAGSFWLAVGYIVRALYFVDGVEKKLAR